MDNIPAFPHVQLRDPTTQFTQTGMTLRDYFAGQVLNGLFSGNNAGGPIDALAERAYIYADAMLEVRDA
jgi:hypothetical protein